jgi:hypothetical protein
MDIIEKRSKRLTRMMKKNEAMSFKVRELKINVGSYAFVIKFEILVI